MAVKSIEESRLDKSTTKTQDARLDKILNEEATALNRNEKRYDDMEAEYQTANDNLIQGTKDWEAEQTRLQNERTDFAIKQVEQQKADREKDYTKEQSGAYRDWQKESNRYGAEAENMAQSGLTDTGYGESSQVRMYTAYQNRVAVARESFERAMVSYDNAITEAKLQNSSALAQIANESFMKQAELALQGVVYKSDLLNQRISSEAQIKQMYSSEYLAMLDAINEEKRLAEEKRQFDAEIKQRMAEFNEQKREFNVLHGSGTSFSGVGSSVKSSAKGSVKVNKGSSSSSGTSSSWQEKNQSKKLEKVENHPQTNEVSTAYWRGDKNKDASKYGTFSNGYQPKGIGNRGEVKKTGETIEVPTEIKYGPDAGKKVTVVQNVWKTPDGQKWYWEGRENKYKPI